MVDIFRGCVDAVYQSTLWHFYHGASQKATLMRNQFIKVCIFSGIFLILFAQVLFGGQMFMTGDLVQLILPNFSFYHEALRSSQSFLWNSTLISGFPVFASFTGLFSPLNRMFFHYMEPVIAYHWLLFFYILATACIMAMLLRVWGLSLSAQIFGALIFVFSQWFIINDLGIVASFPILPGMLLMIWYMQKHGWPIIIGGLGMGFLLLSTHYQWAIMIFLVSGLYAIYLGKRVFGKFLIVLGIGGVLGFVQIWSGYTYAQFSARTGLSWVDAHVGAIGLADLPKIFLPNLQVPLLPHAESLLYIGIVPLFLFILGLWLRDRNARFFKWVFFGSLLLAVQYSPIFWLFHQFPVFDNLRGPSRFMFLGWFAASILASYGLDRFVEISLIVKKRVGKTLVLLGVLVAGGAVILGLALAIFRSKLEILLNQIFIKYYYQTSSHLPLDHYEQVISQALNQIKNTFSLSNWHFSFGLVVLVTGLGLVAWITKTNRLPVRMSIIVTAIGFILVFIGFQPVTSQASWDTKPEILKFIDLSQGRVFTFLSGFTEWQKLTVPHNPSLTDTLVFQQELLVPNLHLRYGVDHIDGYENLMPRRLSKLLALVGSDRATVGDKLADQSIPVENKATLMVERQHILDLLGIRYIISAYPLPETSFRLVGTISATKFAIPILVYENFDFRPFAYLARGVHTQNPDEDEAYQFTKHNTRVLDLVECNPCPGFGQTGAGQVEIISRDHQTINLRARTMETALLVVAQNNLPGWVATLDGQSVEIFSVNSAFMGIEVPKGEHLISFTFQFSLW